MAAPGCLLVPLSVLALILLLSACKSKADANPDDCISSFMSAINSSDRSQVYKNLDSDGADYAAAKASGFWSADFPVSGIPYTLSEEWTDGDFVHDTIGSSYYTATYGGGISITFEMGYDSSGNAVIKTITLQSAEIYG